MRRSWCLAVAEEIEEARGEMGGGGGRGMACSSSDACCPTMKA